MYDTKKSQRMPVRRFLGWTACILGTLAGCQGSNGPARDVPQTDGQTTAASSALAADPLTSAAASNAGAAPKSGAEFSAQMDATAKALEEVPTDNAAQQTAMANTVTVVKQIAQQYALLKPNLSAQALSLWFAAMVQYRAHLKDVAQALRQLGLTATATAIDELSARRDVLVFRRAVPYGGIRHAYVASGDLAGQGNLEGYSLAGVAFQVFDRSLTSRGQAINLPLYQCQAEGTEGRPKIPGVTDTFWLRHKKVAVYFLATSSDCFGQTPLGTIGYIAGSAGVVTSRPLHWLMRWENPRGDEDTNFLDSADVTNASVAQAIVFRSEGKYHSVNDLSRSPENNFIPIGYVP